MPTILLTQYSNFIRFALRQLVDHSYFVVVILFSSFVCSIYHFVLFVLFALCFSFSLATFQSIWLFIIMNYSIHLFSRVYFITEKYVFDLFIPIVYNILHTIIKLLPSRRFLSFEIIMQSIRMARDGFKILIKNTRQTICIQL